MDELKKYEWERIDELERAKDSLGAACIAEQIFRKFGLVEFAKRYMKFIQNRSSIHHK